MARYDWIRLDINAASHDKVLALPDDGTRWRWVTVLLLAGQRNGPAFTRRVLHHHHVTEDDIAAMVEVGLLDTTDDGVTVHDWHTFQPRQVAIEKADDVPRARAGAHPGRASRDAHRNVTERNETLRSNHPRASAAASWDDFDRVEWEPFKVAWIGRGFMWAPSGSQDYDDNQRGILWEIAAARPTDLGLWVTEAPAGLDRRGVIAHVLDRWHEVRKSVPPDPPRKAARREPSKPTALASLLKDAKAAGL